MARLIVTTSDGEDVVDLASGDVITVGRDPSNRLSFPKETRASRRHCRIGAHEGPAGGWELVDLGSTNKTRVNGTIADRKVLSHGDLIEVGDVKIRFEDPEEEERLREAGRQGICYLEWANQEHQGERIILTEVRTSFGRRESNTVRLEDRMVSGHHAEVSKDLNGYTIRDLGSTNGTLVNGEPISEAPLAHGARVRIGNSRFVFKDPSMKDIEVELSQFEEDEGWGMMGEIDLARARGSYAGLIAIVLLFAAAGAGGWWLSQQSAEVPTSEALRLRGVENGDFEGEEILWSATNDELASVRRNARGGRSGAGLQVRHTGEEGSPPALVTYGHVFERTGTRSFRLEAQFRGSGDPSPEFVVIWSSAPTLTELKAGYTPFVRTETLAVASGGWRPVDVVRVPPEWAKTARLGVLLSAGASAALDDVDLRVEREGATAASFEVRGYARAHVDSAGVLDLLNQRTVLVGSAVPLARMPGDRVLTRFVATAAPRSADGGVVVDGAFLDDEDGVDATIHWTPTQEGVQATITCPGADAVGLSTALVAEHLGGAVNVLGEFPPQALPAEPGERLEGVTRVLAGNAEPVLERGRPVTLVNLVPGGGETPAVLELHASRDPNIVQSRLWMTGGRGEIEIITDFALQRDRAQQDLAAARALLGTQPGLGIAELRRVAQSYPFDEAVHDTALTLAQQRAERARADLDELDDAVRAFQIYGSSDALADMSAKAERLEAQFLAEGHPSGPIETRLEELLGQVRQSSRAYAVEHAEPELARLERLVRLLGDDEAYRPLAALYARALADRFGSLSDQSPDLARRIDAVAKRFDELTAEATVRDAIPPRAGSAGGP
ncbi:MAG: FHA domain-containing protein [Planctomycetota bacterium]|jgi:pSer/pThr/pTyr-binding forkhead associated (FHA) protein